MTLFNASAADCGCTETTVCDEEKLDLTGAWLGAGVIVDFDKYDADISVAAEYAGLQDQIRTMRVSNAAAGEVTAEQFAGVLAAMQAHQAPGADVAWGTRGNFLTNGNATYNEADVAGTNTFYAHRTLKLKKTKTVAGGELKGSLFYNVDNGLVFGVDLSLGLTAKSKKTIDVNGQFASQANVVAGRTADGVFYHANADAVDDNTVRDALVEGSKAVTQVTMTTDVGVLAQHKTLANYSYAVSGVEAANAGADVCGEEHSSFVINKVANNQRQAIDADINGKVASAEFEKDIFSPTLAVVVGGYFKGFFGGLRLGMNYMTGKIHNLKNVDGSATHTASHKIRQVSPVIGIQLMKHIKKGVFAYLTYDHMFGINKTFLDSPIKKFKRRQNRISLGLGYQFKANH